MKNILIIITCFASLCLGACSINDWSLVHRIDVQQGNVITQDVINQLEPGMTRRQVQFVAGSPMVADVFHQDRWDYLYRMKTGTGKVTREHVSLYFEDDALVRISGTLHPQEEPVQKETAVERVTLVVPPEERVPPGILSRLWHWVTFRSADETQP
ncbi:MAG: outer membrane protein assembly factor BamE [Halobacteria archaeon]|nr:outer membrane protein assembly factor BamE [Halobacteria archaeon]